MQNGSKTSIDYMRLSMSARKSAIHTVVSRYFQAGGSPEHVIQLLSENYSAVAQTVNLLAEWLIQMGGCFPQSTT